MRKYSSRYAAKTAVKRQGLYNMAYEIRQDMIGQHYPHFFCSLAEDVAELEARGFSAELDKERAVE